MAFTKLWVVVPCKPFAEAKGRLAPYLPPTTRAELGCWLLDRTLRVVLTLPAAGCVVISRDAAALARAAQAGAVALSERGRTLNAALRQGIAAADARGAEALLVLPTDLPLVESEDLADLIAGALPPPSVVIAAAECGGGTNALLLAPPRVIAPAFGRASRRRHAERAERAGAAVRVVHRQRLARDLDTVADLRALAGALPPFVLASSGV
ncbi:MAG: 2-phospho-L-lactate guanylyltransferase [Chloroflexi bacterium]|nr:2-phospho-L-lactate guanylyltransferase [Chloroflexota bacterium]